MFAMLKSLTLTAALVAGIVVPAGAQETRGGGATS